LYGVPEPSPTSQRRGRLLRAAAALVVLLALAGYLTVQYITGGTGARGCKVVSGGEDGTAYDFTPEQARNAATIAAVGTGRGMPERAVAIALATALQESGLRNIRHGDRDSLGLFQQRPSQGWGTRKQILEPQYAAAVFYQHLAEVRGYTKLPLTVAAQRVQHSGFPQAYAKHEPDATVLAAALTGTAAATLTCDGRPGTAMAAGPDGVRAALLRDFGRDTLQPAGAEVGGAHEPKPSATPRVHTGTDTVTLSVDAVGGPVHGREVSRRGWQLAQWAVANSTALRIERVDYGGREWTAGRTDSRWQPVAGGGAGAARTDPRTVRIVTGQ
jgi:hypothetical protein